MDLIHKTAAHAGLVTLQASASGPISGSDLVHLSPNPPFHDTNSASRAIIGSRSRSGAGNTSLVRSGCDSPGSVSLILPVSFGQPEEISFVLLALIKMRSLEGDSNATSGFGLLFLVRRKDWQR
jgi:hypothetical protein